MHEKIDTVVFNSINAGAVGITFVNIEQALTVLVLLTALLYNIKKLSNK